MNKTLPKPVWVLLSLYALSGILLFMLVPELNQMNSFWYESWNTSPNLLIKAYHLPSIIWLLLGGMFTSLIYWVNTANFSLKTKNFFDGLALVVWLILLFHAIDWLTMFSVCHQAKCSIGFLPTWHWLGFN